MSYSQVIHNLAKLTQSVTQLTQSVTQLTQSVTQLTQSVNLAIFKSALKSVVAWAGGIGEISVTLLFNLTL